jgi:Rho termination factor, N-terminal domain
MTKTELESKHLSDLHQLAADAGVERYRMLTRAELIERLSGGDGGGDGDSGGSSRSRSGRSGSRSSGSRGQRSRGSGSRTSSSRDADSDSDSKGSDSDDDGASGDSGSDEGASGERPRRRRRRSSGGGREREAQIDVEEEEEDEPGSSAAKPASPSRDEDDDEGSRPRRPRRRRRRFGRRREGVTIQDLLLPAESGRQTVLLAETREAATDLLRSVAADLSGDAEGPDPVALLIDPSPEELADWKREAPQAELVSAGQARHASDALATAQRRAADGEDVILLVDSLTRFADGFGDAEGAKALFDAGRGDAAAGKGSLTVVVALERS